MSICAENSGNQGDIVQDIRSKDYLNQFSQITDNFELIDKIGEGSFAVVYVVKSKKHSSLKEKFALKFTIPTIDPRRIENELRILKKIGGRKNVVKLHLSFRVHDHIFMLMPLVDHIKFVDYYLKMDTKEIQDYLRNLLIALMHVHENKIIHRDVKPNNFLYDRARKRFTLVDFGLAHSEQHDDGGVWFDGDNNMDLGNDKFSVTHLNSSNGQMADFGSFTSRLSETNSLTEVNAGNVMCVCGHRLTTCTGCRNKPRPQARRGGTIGYRPPEVMMRYPEQTTAVDVWAVGIIMAVFLTGNFPFLKVEDDIEVLYSLMYFLSFEKMQAGAREIERHIVADPKPKPLLGDHVTWLRSRCSFMRQQCQRISKLFNEENKTDCIYGPNYLFDDSAYDLLLHLLDPVFRTRFTCKEALDHKFFKKNFTLYSNDN